MAQRENKASNAIEAKEKKGSRAAPKAVGTGATRLKFDEKPDVWPTDDAKKKNPGLEEDLFDEDALGSEIPTTDDYAAGSKKEYMDKNVFKYKSNEMNPTTDY